MISFCYQTVCHVKDVCKMDLVFLGHNTILQGKYNSTVLAFSWIWDSYYPVRHYTGPESGELCDFGLLGLEMGINIAVRFFTFRYWLPWFESDTVCSLFVVASFYLVGVFCKAPAPGVKRFQENSSFHFIRIKNLSVPHGHKKNLKALIECTLETSNPETKYNFMIFKPILWTFGTWFLLFELENWLTQTAGDFLG